MSNFIIQVQDAENQASKQKNEAKQKASSLIQEAKKTADLKNEQLHKNCNEEAQAKLENTKKETKSVYSQNLEQFNSKMHKIEKTANTKQESVVEEGFNFIMNAIK